MLACEERRKSMRKCCCCGIEDERVFAGSRFARRTAAAALVLHRRAASSKAYGPPKAGVAGSIPARRAKSSQPSSGFVTSSFSPASVKLQSAIGAYCFADRSIACAVCVRLRSLRQMIRRQGARSVAPSPAFPIRSAPSVPGAACRAGHAGSPAYAAARVRGSLESPPALALSARPPCWSGGSPRRSRSSHGCATTCDGRSAVLFGPDRKQAR